MKNKKILFKYIMKLYSKNFSYTKIKKFLKILIILLTVAMIDQTIKKKSYYC